MNFVQNMNDNQLKAILKTEGAVMVIAGAGSGKTRVLTNRIAYLIAEKNILESNILAITFTNKAAKELFSNFSFFMYFFISTRLALSFLLDLIRLSTSFCFNELPH